MLDICQRKTAMLKEGLIVSPNYPNFYPSNQDCSCTMTTKKGTNIFISVYDLALENGQDGHCADWLYLESGSGDDRLSDVNCGHIVQDSKNMTIRSNKLRLHFHADKNDNHTQAFKFNTIRQLKGFWLYFTCKYPQVITHTQ